VRGLGLPNLPSVLSQTKRNFKLKFGVYDICVEALTLSNVKTHTGYPAIARVSASTVLIGNYIMADSVGVAIRVRPYLPGEDETPNQGTTADVSDPKVAEVRVRIKSKKIDLRSTFGKVFPTSATQQDVFDYCEAAVDGSLRGINATVFAYGQTNSGKTHTMLGSLEDIGPSTGKRSTNGADATANDGLDGDDPMGESNVHSVVGDNAGLIPRAAHRLFQLAAADEELNLTVTCSFLQIYNNQVFDLLRDKSMRRPLRIRERRKQGIFINGLSQVQVSCAADIVSLLKSGGARRAVRGTEYNEQSSRSHAILQLAIESQREKQDPSDEDKTRRVIHRAKLNLVDLAGSEKWNTSVRMGAAQQKELTHINSSLSALGNVISALSDDKRSHVPYRDSALTRILQDALGGNSRTVLIATVAPTLHCAEESISTLKFADRASHVKLKIRVNELLDDATLLARAKREIVRLKRLLKKKSTKQMKQIEDDLKLFREMNDRLRAENAQLRQQLRTFGVHFPGTPKNGSAAAKNAGGGNMIYASPRSASADPSARDMHPLEQVRPFTTGTLPKLATSPGKVKLSPNARPSKTNTSAWATNSNDSTDERYATLEARIRAMEEAFQHGRSIEDSEAPRTDTHAAVVAAVEALDDNELTARLAAVDEDEAMSLIQQEEEYVVQHMCGFRSPMTPNSDFSALLLMCPGINAYHLSVQSWNNNWQPCRQCSVLMAWTATWISILPITTHRFQVHQRGITLNEDPTTGSIARLARHRAMLLLHSHVLIKTAARAVHKPRMSQKMNVY